MNLFNRVFTVFTLLFWIALAAVLMVAPWYLVESLEATLRSIYAAPFGQISLVIGCAVAIALCFVVLYFEFRRPKRTGVLLGKMGGATAELSIDAISQRLRRETQTLADVRQVEPVVEARGSKVDVRVTVYTNPDIDVPEKAAEVSQLLRENLEQRMGLKVGRLWVNIKHDVPGEASAAAR